jgi:hypothetical protein
MIAAFIVILIHSLSSEPEMNQKVKVTTKAEITTKVAMLNITHQDKIKKTVAK